MDQKNKRPDACEAAAWCVMCAGEVEFVADSVYDCEAWIAATQRNRGAVAVAPLYRKPQTTLTAEERQAVETGEYLARQAGTPPMDAVADTLRLLLERLK